MPTLLVCLPDDQLPDLDRVRALAPEFEVVRTRSKEDVRPHLGEVTVALGYFPPALVAEAPALEWIQSCASIAQASADPPTGRGMVHVHVCLRALPV